MHVLGIGVPRRLGVARSASSHTAAQALGCSLTPNPQISFGRVTCMARAASVPGLWTLGFLLLCGVCVLVRVVFGLGVRLRPATPGWDVGVCVCLCARSACSPPLLAGVCGVVVCAWARFRLRPATPGWGVGYVCVGVRAPLVPRHSWLGCAAWVCVLVLGFRLRPATPGWGDGVCVCSCARSACTPPLLAGLLGCVCVRVPAPLVPRHSWLGCAAWVCVLGLGFRLRPATPGLAVGYVCVCVRASLLPRHSWHGCAAWVCVLGPGFRLRIATPGWGVGVCVCSCARSACTPPLLAGVCGVGVCARGWGFGCAPPLRAGVLGRVCVRVPTPLVLRHSWLGCVVLVCSWALVLAAHCHSWLGCWGVCVLVCALRLYPAIPGSGVWCGCVCSGSGFGCAPPLLAGVLGCGCVCVPALLVRRHSWLGCVMWVCVWARVSAAPRHSWLGCWDVCVFVCPLRLYPATPGWGVRRGCVCLGSGFGCAPRLLAGVLGCGCVCVPAPLVRHHSWLGCVVWVCVWARVSAAPRHSWRGCWGVCVFVCPLRLYPATPGSGVWCGCVCSGSGFGCAPRLLAGLLGMCVFVCALRLYAATPGWGVRRGCVYLGSGFGCAPPLLAGVMGCVCVRVRAPLVPRHSWLGCWGVSVFACPLRLYRATPGSGVRRGCVCLRSGFGCAPPLLAGLLGMCVFVCALR